MRWVVQNNLGGIYADKIQKACLLYNYEFVPNKVIPFSEEIPSIDNRDLTIFYGATRWISNIQKNNKWKPGVFFDPTITYETWSNKYKQNCLNYNCPIMTLDELYNKIDSGNYKWDELIFIRPISDQKEFAGEVIAAKNIYEWIGKIQHDVKEFGKTEILVSEPFGIASEWRLFIVDGKVSSGSRYREYYELSKSPIIPDEVTLFAEKMATIYSPSDIFVIDIGKSGDTLYVIEIGCFNSAGFYEADVNKIIKDISTFCETKYGDQDGHSV